MYRYYKFDVSFLQLIIRNGDFNALFSQLRTGFTIAVALC